MKKILKKEPNQISGKTLSKILGVNPREYKVLYPNIHEKGYCPGMDLMGHTQDCQGMMTAMDALKRNKSYQLPIPTMTISTPRAYKSGEIWIDEMYKIAYLYIGKSKNDMDVVLNLGGETSKRGEIQTGKINKKFDNEIFFDRRVFPK